MDWNDYLKYYSSFSLSLNQAMLVGVIGSKLLEDFPNSLPEGIREPVVTTIHNMNRFLDAQEASHLDGAKGLFAQYAAALPNEIASIESSATGIDMFLVLRMLLARSNTGYELTEVEFDRVIRSQNLVMLLAYFDGFIADSVRAICISRPEVMKNRKQKLDWEKALSFADIEELRTHFTEEVVFQYGTGSFSKRFENLEERFKLEIRAEKKDTDLLNFAQQARNVIVHNGGKASLEFLRITKSDKHEPKYKLGDNVVIPDGDIVRLYDVLQVLASRLFMQISVKYMNKEKPDLEEMGYSEL